MLTFSERSNRGSSFGVIPRGTEAIPGDEFGDTLSPIRFPGGEVSDTLDRFHLESLSLASLVSVGKESASWNS